MISLRIWFLLFVAIYYCSSQETTEYIPEVYDYIYLGPEEICNENQTKEGCNDQICIIGQETGNSLCEGQEFLCKCKKDYWTNSSGSCVLYKDCDVFNPYRYRYY